MAFCMHKTVNCNNKCDHCALNGMTTWEEYSEDTWRPNLAQLRNCKSTSGAQLELLIQVCYKWLRLICGHDYRNVLHDKVHHRTGHEGPDGEYSQSSNLSGSLALYGGGGQWSTPRPGRFTPGTETRYPLYRRLGGPKGRFVRAQKIPPPPRIRLPIWLIPHISFFFFLSFFQPT